MKWPCTVYRCWFRTSYTNLIILSSNRQHKPETDTAHVQCFPTPRSLFRGAGCASIILLTPRSTFLLENLSSLTRQKFLLIYGHRMLMTVFTRARHLSLSWARSVQFTPPSYFLKIIFNIIYPRTYVFKVAFFLHVSAPKPCVQLSSPTYVPRARPILLLFVWLPGKYFVGGK
jgi:hypothetical protein